MKTDKVEYKEVCHLLNKISKPILEVSTDRTPSADVLRQFERASPQLESGLQVVEISTQPGVNVKAFRAMSGQ